MSERREEMNIADNLSRFYELGGEIGFSSSITIKLTCYTSKKYTVNWFQGCSTIHLLLMALS